MLTPSAFEDRRSSQGRLVAIRLVAMICFAVLAVSFWILQVISNAEYAAMAENNHLRTIPLRAPRGIFYDRNNKILVENKYAYAIAVIRERTKDPPAAIAKRLAAVVGPDLEGRIKDTLVAHGRDPLFQSTIVIENASDAQVAGVMARRRELPEVVVEEIPVRAYPVGGMAAHLVGYVNEISGNQLKQAEFAGYAAGTMVGQAGLEKAYNTRLMGKDGKKDVFVNSQNREVGDAVSTEVPVEGQRLQLTIDYDLQHALDEAFMADGVSGAAAFLDPMTGEVLAMTSKPEFDPNDFAGGIETAKWNKLANDLDKPLRNRLIQNRYPPGSTFKILIAIAALSEGVITPDTHFTCLGSKTFYNQLFHCDKKEGHGSLDLRQAIEQSCNVYFYHVGDLLGVDTIYAYAQKLGLIGKTGIDLPEETDSRVPSSAWKLKQYGEKWYPSETMSITIGQGYVDTTPISLAVMMSVVANGGTIITPHVVKAVGEGQGWRPVPPPEPRGVFPFKPEVLKPVVDGLWMVVNGHGTASKAKIAGHDVIGKTGTAQVISDEGKRKAIAAGKGGQELGDNGWFVFAAPRDTPRIAGVVFVEHGGHGGAVAAPIARHVMETFFAKQENRPLPVYQTIKATPAAAAPPARAPQTGGTGTTPAAAAAIKR